MPPYGSTRNLTHQFIRLRNEARKLQGIGTVAQSDNSSVAPSWVQQSNGIQQKLKVLKKLIAELKKYHDEALLVTFNRNSGAQDAEMLTLEVQQRFKQLHAEIRTTGPNNDAEIQKRVQQQLAQALFKLSLEFRREEMRFLNKVEEQMGMERGSSIGLIEEEEGTWTGGELMDPGFTQAQMAMVDISTYLVNEQDMEIRKILKTIEEVVQIMNDLDVLVIKQGTMLDRIDQNITQTAIRMEDGVRQLQVAEMTQKRGCMFMCIITLIHLIVLMLIIIVIRHT